MITRIGSGITNCYLLSRKNMKKHILVDTGIYQDKSFVKKLDAAGKLSEIGLIILTHGHFDHVGHAAELQNGFHIPIAIHKKDAEKYEKSPMEFPPIRGRMGNFVGNAMTRGLQKAVYPRYKPDILLDSQQELDGFPEIEILYLPGHSQGSIGVVFEGCLLIGDLIMNVGIPSLSFMGDDFALMKESIHSMSQRQFKNVYPGHGFPFSGHLLSRLF